MRFELTQKYRSSASAVASAYADADLYPTLMGLPKLGDIEVLDLSEVDGHVRSRIRYGFTGDLPSAVTAVVDPDRLTWIQETDQDLEAGTATFRLLPDHYPDRLSAKGTFRIVSDGEGARRVVNGELKVKVLLVAGKVEGAIVGGLKEYLAAEGPAVDAYLAG